MLLKTKKMNTLYNDLSRSYYIIFRTTDRFIKNVTVSWVYYLYLLLFYFFFLFISNAFSRARLLTRGMPRTCPLVELVTPRRRRWSCTGLAAASFSELGLDVGRQRSHVQQHVEHHRGHREHEAGHQVDLRVGHRRRVPLVHVRVAVRVPAHERVRRGYGAVLPRALRQPHVLPASVERLGRQVRGRVPGLRGVRDPRQPVRHAPVRSKRL